ncbi:MAG: hypothetical protein AABX71_02610, partial [Nanoarchaeota archaeon]
MKPKKVPVKIFVPFGFYEDYEKRGIPIDEKFSIKPSELKAEDWIITFNLNIIEPAAVLIERAVTKLREAGENFMIRDIISELEKGGESKEIKNSAVSLFEAAETWKVFCEKEEEATEISELVKVGTTTILDLSMYSSVGAFNVRALVIG